MNASLSVRYYSIGSLVVYTWNVLASNGSATYVLRYVKSGNSLDVSILLCLYSERISLF